MEGIPPASLTFEKAVTRLLNEEGRLRNATTSSLAPPYHETTLAAIQTLVSSISVNVEDEAFSEPQSQDPHGCIP